MIAGRSEYFGGTIVRIHRPLRRHRAAFHTAQLSIWLNTSVNAKLKFPDLCQVEMSYFGEGQQGGEKVPFPSVSIVENGARRQGLAFAAQ